MMPVTVIEKATSGPVSNRTGGGTECASVLILDLVRLRKLSRVLAVEFLQIVLREFPALLAQYRIPWFDYSPEMLREDLNILAAQPRPPSA